MIDRAIQRGGGQNLASHFMKEWDNDQITIAEIRGAVAQDLHGAFKEWYLASKATNAKQYLFTVAINPDPKQPEWSRDQYYEFIARMEGVLGLEGQPRAVVFHSKYGREHAHVTWSRIYAETVIENGIEVSKFKAKQMDFYKDRIMRTAIEFAADIDYQLPEGYGDWQQGQFSDLENGPTEADKAAERKSGITTKQHAAILTQAWQQSDNARSFKAALEQRGYILARGDKRVYVAIDRDGNTHSLSRRIEGVKTKDLKARLGDTFAIDPEVAKANPALKLLPTVTGARKSAAKRKSAMAKKTRSDFNSVSDEANHKLDSAQKKRRRKLAAEQKDQNKDHPEDYRLIEQDRLARNLDQLDQAERDALNEFLARRQRTQARRGEGQSAIHLSGAALQAVQSAAQALRTFNQSDPHTAPLDKNIRKLYSEIGRLEGREKYAATLRTTIRKQFQIIYGAKAPRAYKRYQRLIEKQGIERAAKMLRFSPERFGAIAGWSITRYYHTKTRKHALAALQKVIGDSRKSFYIDRKLPDDLKPLPELRARLETLKAQQREQQHTPAQGRIFLQYLLADAGNRLSTDDMTLLTNAEKFQLNEARRLMRDPEIIAWTRARLRAFREDDKPVPSAPAAATDLQRVDLKDISAAEMRRYLNRHYRSLQLRHESERDAVDTAYKYETHRILKHREGYFDRTIGALASLTGLREALDQHRAAHDKARADEFRTQRLALRQRHDAEDAPFKQDYRRLKARERALRDRYYNAKPARDLGQDFKDKAMSEKQRREEFRRNAGKIGRKNKRGRDQGTGYGYDRDDDE